MSVGTTIRTIRNNKKITLKMITEITGLSKSTLSDIENDKSSPSVDTLNKIATALEVPVTDFFINPNDTVSNHNNVNSDNERAPGVKSPKDILECLSDYPELADHVKNDFRNLSPEEAFQVVNDVLFALELSMKRIDDKKNKL
jgi:transcriptional regulator with XRE-family HTH domain